MAPRRRFLTCEEIEYVMNKSDSEDEIGISDDGILADQTFVPLRSSETESVHESEDSDSSNVASTSVNHLLNTVQHLK